MRRRLLIFVSVTVALVLGVPIGVVGIANTSWGRDRVADLIETVTEGGPITIRIGALTGTVPTAMVLSDIELSDRSGVFATVGGAGLRWRIASLLQGVISIQDLEVSATRIDRLPETGEDLEAGPPSLGPVVPTLRFEPLPMDVAVERVRLEDVVLGPSVLGEEFTLEAEVSGVLSRTDAGVTGWVEASRPAAPRARLDLDLAVSPSTGVLRAEVEAAEPVDGLVAALIGLEERTALAVSLIGSGTIEDWKGTLSGGFGPGASADLDLSVAVTADTVGIDVEGRVEGDRVVPPELRPVVAGGAAVSGSARIVAQGRVALNDLRFRSRGVDAAASLATDDSGIPIEGSLTVDLPALEPFGDALGLPVSGRLAASVRLEDAGRQATAIVDGDLAFAEVAAVDAMTVAVTVSADRPFALAPERIGLQTAATVAMPTIDAADLSALFGSTLGVNVSASLGTTDLVLTIDEMTAVAEGVSMDASGTVRPDSSGQLDYAVTVPDLARFDSLTGLRASGTVSAEGTVGLALDGLGLTAIIDGAATDLTIADPIAEAVLGSDPTLVVGVTLDPDRRLSFHELDLRLESATVRGDGSLDLDGGTLAGRVDVTVPDLTAVSAPTTMDLAGSVGLALALGGTIDRPAASASWRGDGVVIDGLRLDRTTGSATTVRDGAQWRGDIAAQIALVGEPVDLAARYAAGPEAVRLDAIALDGLGASASGNLVAEIRTGRVVGSVLLSAADLGLIGSVLDLPVTAGRAEASINLSGEREQTVEADIKVENLGLEGEVSVDRLEVTADIVNPGENADGRLDVRVTGAGGGVRRGAMQVDLSDGQAAIALSVDGEAGVPFRFTATASTTVATLGDQLVVERMDGTFGEVAISQSTAVTVGMQPVLAIDGLDLSVDNGRIVGRASFDPAALEVVMAFRDIPVDLLRLVDEDIGPQGVVNGDLTVSGPIEVPSVLLTLETEDVRPTNPDLTDVPALVARAEVRIDDGRFLATAEAKLGDGVEAALQAAAPLASPEVGQAPVLDMAAPLEARVEVDVDLARVMAYLPVDDVLLAGRFGLHVSGAGTLEAPVLSGTAALSDGLADVADAGLYLRDITLEAFGEGDRLVLRSFSARAVGGGGISGAGWISADPDAGFPVDLSFQARDFNAVDVDEASVSVDLDLGLSGAAPDYLLSGSVVVLPTEIRIPDSLPPSVVELDVIEVQGGQAIEKPVAPVEPSDTRLPLSLDVQVSVPGEVFVRGRGLDSEWGGAVQATGPVTEPEVGGEIAVRRGGFEALGRSFAFDRGRIIFDGGPAEDPAIDMRLTTEVTDIAAAVVVGGRASNPEIGLESDPVLPEEDILSRLLFGSDKAELSPLQALQLARSAAILSGRFGAGPGITDQVRDALGVDTFDVDTAATEDGTIGASLSVGKYVAPGVFLKLQQGLSGATSRAVVEVDVADNVTLETDVGADSQSRVGVNWKLDY